MSEQMLFSKDFKLSNNASVSVEIEFKPTSMPIGVHSIKKMHHSTLVCIEKKGEDIMLEVEEVFALLTYLKELLDFQSQIRMAALKGKL